ncbi:unnamed protein product, partial [marine sediment metagenome]
MAAGITSQKFKDSNADIQAAGMDATNAETVAANIQTTVFTADTLVEVADVEGAGVWFEIVTAAASIVPAADSGVFIPPFG